MILLYLIYYLFVKLLLSQQIIDQYEILGDKVILTCSIVEIDDVPANTSYWSDGIFKFFNGTKTDKYDVFINTMPTHTSLLTVFNSLFTINNLSHQDAQSYVCNYNNDNISTINLIIDDININVTASPEDVTRESLYEILSAISIQINVTKCCAEQGVTKECRDPCEGKLGHKDTCIEFKDRIDMCIISGKDHRKCCNERLVDEKCVDLCAHSSSDELYRQCKKYLPDIFQCIEEGNTHLPSPPTFITARALNSTTIEVRWQPPEHNLNSVNSYVIVHSKITLPTDTEMDTVFHSSIVRDYTTSENLSQFGVRPSSVIYFNPAETTVGIPKISTTNSHTSLVAEVSHDDSVALNPSYVELPKLIMPLKNTSAIKIPPYLFRFNVTGLEPGSAYEIYMYSLSAKGSSLPSDIVEAFTPSLTQPVLPDQEEDQLAETDDRLDNLKSASQNVTRSLASVIRCCKSKGIPMECVDTLCKMHGNADYNTFLPALGNCAPHLQSSMKCIIDGRNHTECCVISRVPPKCYPFCDGTHDRIDEFSRATCLFDLSSVTSCIRQGYEILPSSPRGLRTLYKGTFLVTIDWFKPLKNPDLIISYSIYFRKIGEFHLFTSGTKLSENEVFYENSILRDHSYYDVITTTDFKHNPPYTFLNFVPATWYEVFVVANAVNGSSIPSHSLRFRTLPLTDFDSTESITSGEIPVPPIHTFPDSSTNSTPFVRREDGLSYDDTGNDNDLKADEKFLNEKARNCCIKAAVPDDCAQKICNYDLDLTTLTIINALLSTCSIHFSKALVCLADQRDHAQCCRENGIVDSCSMFCRSQVPVGLDIYKTCEKHATTILSCFKKGIRKLPRPPARFLLLDSSPTTLTLSWKTPDLSFLDDSVNGTTLTYKVIYIPKKTFYRPDVLPTIIKVNDTKVVIDKLKPNTTYRMYVSAVNEHGSSLPSYVITATTLDNKDTSATSSLKMPPRPREIFIKEVGLDYIRLEWGHDKVSSFLQAQLHYLLRYHDGKEDEPDYPALADFHTINVTDKAYNLTNLKPNTLYRIYLTSGNSMYESLRSEIITIKTRHQSSPKAFITIYPHQYIKEGMTVVLNCKAEGYPIPQISWYAWNDKFKSPIWHEENLTLSNIHHSASGQYKCVARNGLLPKGKDFVHLKVAFRPLVIAKHKEIHSRIYHSAELVCIVEAYPLTTKNVFWYRKTDGDFDFKRVLPGAYDTNYRMDLVRIDQLTPAVRRKYLNSPSYIPPSTANSSLSGNAQSGQDGNVGDGEKLNYHDFNIANDFTYVYRLIIKTLERDNFTKYMCQAQNGYGTDRDYVEIVNNEFTTTESIVIQNIPTNSSLNLVDTGGPNVLECCENMGVKLECRRACYLNINLNATIFQQQPNKLESNHIPDTEYKQQQQQISLTNSQNPLLNSNALISCLPDLPKLVHCAADGRNHEVCCRRKNVPEHCLKLCEGTVPITANVYSCLYFSQAIVDCYYNGSLSIPSMPTNVRGAFVHENGIILRWDPPEKNKYAVDGYLIYYRQDNETSWNITQVKATAYRFTNLNANVKYIFQIESRNGHGWSKRTPELMISTTDDESEDFDGHFGVSHQSKSSDDESAISPKRKRWGPLGVALFTGMIFLIILLVIALYLFYKRHFTSQPVSFDNPGYDKEHVLEDMRGAKYNNQHSSNFGYYDDISDATTINNEYLKSSMTRPSTLLSTSAKTSSNTSIPTNFNTQNDYHTLYDNHKLIRKSLTPTAKLNSPMYDYITTSSSFLSSPPPYTDLKLSSPYSSPPTLPDGNKGLVKNDITPPENHKLTGLNLKSLLGAAGTALIPNRTRNSAADISNEGPNNFTNYNNHNNIRPGSVTRTPNAANALNNSNNTTVALNSHDSSFNGITGWHLPSLHALSNETEDGIRNGKVDENGSASISSKLKPTSTKLFSNKDESVKDIKLLPPPATRNKPSSNRAALHKNLLLEEEEDILHPVIDNFKSNLLLHHDPLTLPISSKPGGGSGNQNQIIL